MKIGELAQRTGCKVVTIRFYEKEGLLPEPERSDGNYRIYTEKDEERLNFIRHCRRHGMNLEEISRLLQLSTMRISDHEEIHELIKRHIANIRRQIAELGQLEQSLESMLQNCAGHGSSCDVLASLGNYDLCSYCRCQGNGREEQVKSGRASANDG